MKKSFIIATAILGLVNLSQQALADGGLSRQQVLAELQEAQRTGDIAGPDGIKLNEVYPDHYPAQAQAKPVSRDQVLAELAEAQRTGDYFVGDGLKANELHPTQVPGHAAGRSREEVLAELKEAQRTGDIQGADGELLKDLFPGHYAKH